MSLIEDIKSNKEYAFKLPHQKINKIKKKYFKLLKNWASYEVLSFTRWPLKGTHIKNENDQLKIDEYM